MTSSQWIKKKKVKLRSEAVVKIKRQATPSVSPRQSNGSEMTQEMQYSMSLPAALKPQGLRHNTKLWFGIEHG